MQHIRPTAARQDIGCAQRAGSVSWQVGESLGRGLVMAAANTFLGLPNLIRHFRGQEPRWLWIPGHAERRDTARKQAVRELRCASRGPALVTLVHLREALGAMGREGLPDRLRAMPRPEAGYFATRLDRRVREPELRHGAMPLRLGLPLLAAYYARKYDAKIEFPDSHEDSLVASEFALNPRSFIDRLRQGSGDVRHAFCLDGAHSIPVVYMREGGKEAVLVADSQGGHSQIARDIAQAFAKDAPGLRVYEVCGKRQNDFYSCYTDAVKTAVTLTGRTQNVDGSHGRYRVPNLIGELEGRCAEPQHGVRSVRLPAELLKLSQSRQFVADQMRKRGDPALRDDPLGRKLQQVMADYSVKRTVNGEQRQSLDYLRQKGLAYAEIIQIEFYNQQLIAALGADAWTVREQNEFARQMKALLRSTV